MLSFLTASFFSTSSIVVRARHSELKPKILFRNSRTSGYFTHHFTITAFLWNKFMPQSTLLSCSGYFQIKIALRFFCDSSRFQHKKLQRGNPFQHHQSVEKKIGLFSPHNFRIRSGILFHCAHATISEVDELG